MRRLVRNIQLVAHVTLFEILCRGSFKKKRNLQYFKNMTMEKTLKYNCFSLNLFRQLTNNWQLCTCIYYILSCAINAPQKQIKVISITNENISLYFQCSIFFIISDFSIYLMQLTSKVQMTITFLFVNKNIERG